MKAKWLVGVVIFLVLMGSVSAYYSYTKPSITTAELAYNVDTRFIQNNYYKYPQFKFQVSNYQCTDSDGGINPYLFGAVLRIARTPTQECRDWATQYDQMCPPDPAICAYDPAACTAILAYCASVRIPTECFGTTGVDRCVGSSMVKEYYCSGSDIRYRYMSCSRGCYRGACQ